MDKFSPTTLDLQRFKESPFIAKTLRTAKYVFIRDDRLGKPGLAPRYTGPFRVLQKDWNSSVIRVDLGKKQDTVALSHLKAAFVPEDQG